MKSDHVISGLFVGLVLLVCCILLVIADPYLKAQSARSDAAAMSPSFGRAVGVAQASTSEEAEKAKKIGEAYKLTSEGDLAREKALTEQYNREKDWRGAFSIGLEKLAGSLCGAGFFWTAIAIVLGMAFMWKLMNK